METWVTRIKVLFISGVFASIGNWIATVRAGKPVMPHEAIPGLLMMFGVIIVGCLIDDAARKFLNLKLPNIIYISFIAIVLSIPGFSPVAETIITNFGKIGLLALCTPILAYAGIAIGKDLEDFKKQGLAIMCTPCLTFVGTYIGSAVIAQVVLKLTNAI